MAKTNAERQSEYRARAALEGDQRFSTYLPPATHHALEELAQYHGLSMRDVLIGLIKTASSRQFKKYPDDLYAEHLAALSEPEKGR